MNDFNAAAGGVSSLLAALAAANPELRETEARHGLQAFMTRLLFCFYADALGLFPNQQFAGAFNSCMAPDGAGAQAFFQELHAALALEARPASMRPCLRVLPCIGRDVFYGACFLPNVDADAMARIHACMSLPWHQISPLIFGTAFQMAMDPGARRQGGVHYTCEDDVLKLIRPLFLDELEARFERIMSRPVPQRRAELEAFRGHLTGLTFLDPACGCGNFLIIAYRELSRIEGRILMALHDLGAGPMRPGMNRENFRGIEIDHCAVMTARAGMLVQACMSRIEIAACMEGRDAA